jgi:hypothetical protein
VKLPTRTRTRLAWSLWLVTIGCCAAFLAVTLVLWPLTLAVVAVFSLVFVLGYATVGLVVTLRRPANPIGWLYAAVGLIAALTVPLAPWLDWLVQTGRPCPWPPSSRSLPTCWCGRPPSRLG